LVLIAGAYLAGAPVTVQTGDTGELASAAFNLNVAHPPGYPLFILIQSFFIHVFAFGSVFLRASAVNILFGVGALGFLALSFRKTPFLALGLILNLAFSKIFWRFSELPDVFILNAFFVAAILYFYFQEGNEPKNKYLPVVFFLGLANHLTLIFLLPIVVDQFLRSPKKRIFAFWSLVGIVISAALYSSLFLMNPEDLHSWGDVTSLEGFIHHLLRSDYGTFRLVADNEQVSFWSHLEFFWVQTSEVLWAPILFFGFLAVKSFLKRQNLSRGEYVLWGSLLLYIGVFFGLSNLRLIRTNIEVFERFFILPQLLLIFLVAQRAKNLNLQTTKGQESAMLAVFVLGAGLNFYRFYEINDFSKNTIVEDYAVNLLEQVPKGQKIILIPDGDTRIHAVLYAQTVLGIRTDVEVLNPRLLMLDWYFEKIQRRYRLRLDREVTKKENRFLIEKDLFQPNFEEFSFITNMKSMNTTSYHAQTLPVGYLIKKGTGTSLGSLTAKALQIRSDSKLIRSETEDFDAFREIWSDYAFYPLAQAFEAVNAGNIESSLQSFQKALDLVPWCTPAALFMCQTKADRQIADPNCVGLVEDIHKKYFFYF
jgi:hypothetical protein